MTQRLIITNIVVENFKSYAGVRNLGPFHESFTCVVGPNGSGKSNVIDAVQFVFGKRGNKIRLKKLSELIHKSENYSDLRYAKVAVHFEEIFGDSEPFQVVPKSQFIVSRTVNDKSVSQYYINDEKSNLTDVETLLKSKGIDLDNNRFLILQGEVEQIALLKPKALTEHEDGLLEYIDDIIGTQKYKPMIDEKEKVLEVLNVERNEKLNRVKSSEKDKESLEGPKVEAEAFISKKKELLSKKILLEQITAKKQRQAEADLKSRRVQYTNEYEGQLSELKKLIDSGRYAENSYRELKKEYDRISNELLEVKSDFTTMERKHIKVQQDLENFIMKKKQCEDSIDNNQEKIDAARAKIEKSIVEEQETKDFIMKMKGELQQAEYSVEKILASLQNEIGPIRILLEQKQKEVLPYKNTSNAILQKISIAEGEIGLLNRTTQNLQQQVKGMKEKIQQTQEDLERKQEEILNLQKTLKQLDGRVPELKGELEGVCKEEQELKAELNLKQLRIDQTKAQSVSHKNQSNVVNAILKAKHERLIEGIHDRLGDLGTIDKKYDVAISTACPSLNNIVVETTDGAKQCVEYLRKNNVGVATFLMMDKILANNSNSAAALELETPENVPRLFDLVKVKDSKFRPIFYHALRDTLVANDLEQATRIAYGKVDGKRWRVVTLKGEMIETSGTMSGGGKKAQSGGMSAVSSGDYGGELLSPKEVSRLQKELEEGSQKLRQLCERKLQLSRDLKEVENTREKELALSKMQMELKSFQGNLQEYQKMSKEYEQELQATKKDSNREMELQKEIEGYQKELQRNEASYLELSKEIQGLQQQLNEAGGSNLRVFREKVSVLTQQIDESTSKLTKLQVQKETNAKAIPKLEKQIEKSKGDLGSVQQKITLCEEDKANIEKKAEEVLLKVQQVKDAQKQREDNLLQMEKEYETYKVKSQELKVLEIDYKSKVEDLDKELKDSGKKAFAAECEIEKLEKEAIEFDEFVFIQEVEEHVDNMEVEEQVVVSKDGGKKNSSVIDGNKKSSGSDSKKKSQKKLDSIRAPEESLENVDVDSVQYEIKILDSELQSMKPNLASIKEYAEKYKVYMSRYAELEKITEQRNSCQKEFDELRKKRLDEFMKGFSAITMKLKEIYRMITLGGDAELELVDSLDPFSEGIVFSVRPPKKSWKNISNLSGGEKTLSSLALVFALHHLKPTPIYVMDEIDAALDFRNVSIIANYIKQRTKNCAQFIVISLRNNMFELADRLVGIYKTENVSKTVCINPNAVSEKLVSITRQALGGSGNALSIVNNDSVNSNNKDKPSVNVSKAQLPSTGLKGKRQQQTIIAGKMIQ